ncbi:DEAD/DEAH box helicase, partial [Limnothrix redekei LRLZ20PSL1]
NNWVNRLWNGLANTWDLAKTPARGAGDRVMVVAARSIGSIQMNRLVQGDVGSGKTIVAFLSMLMALDSDCQACLMAPTEILAEQHFNGLQPLANKMGLPIAKLTGSTKTKERKVILEALANGVLPFIVGTHALLEPTVKFKRLGLSVVDEQHRFGVAQRARLWEKNLNEEGVAVAPNFFIEFFVTRQVAGGAGGRESARQ